MNQAALTEILKRPPLEAWDIILDFLWKTMSGPIEKGLAEPAIIERDLTVGEMDNLLCGSAWELWREVENSQLKTSSLLKEFWRNNEFKAVLVLDGLSLREVPWILEQCKIRGFLVHRNIAAFSEIPGDTNSFAKAVGFGQRSGLANNNGKSDLFPNAWTETLGIPFADCSAFIKAQQSIFFWHHWPDSVLHTYADEGNGSRILTKIASETLVSDDFWNFITRLSTGRKLVITSDHGYANSGLFHPLQDKEQNDYMRNLFHSGRMATNILDNDHCWVPPLTLQQEKYSLALGRRKWKSQGGYPTLVHGGLSLLESTVPFIEITKRN